MNVHQTDSQESNSVDWIVKFAWLSLIWGVVLAPILMTIAYSETAGPAYYSHVAPVVHTESGPLSGVMLMTAQFGLLAVGAGAIVLAVRFPRPLTSGLGIWLGAIALMIGPFFSSFFGTEMGVSTALLRLPILFSAAFFLPSPGLNWFIRRCRGAIEFYTALTLIAVVILPSWVLTTGYYASLLPGIDIRLHGIAGHANNFAIMLLVYLVISWMLPAKTRWEWFWLVVVAVSLVFTQSKTVWALVALVYLVRMFYLSVGVRIVALYATTLGATVASIVLTFIRPYWTTDLIEGLFQEDVVTLTGRTNVWAWTIELWRENPAFGYGPNLWNQEMGLNFAAQYGWIPSHAHNQFVESLGESGIIGLAGLLVFFALLVNYGVHYHRLTGGATLALTLALLVRSITELPLNADIGESFFAFFVTFAVFVLISQEARQPASNPQPTSPAGVNAQRVPAIGIASGPLRNTG